MKVKVFKKLLLCLITVGLILVRNVISTELESDQISESLFVDEQDSLALVNLFNGTDGPNWIINTNWLTGPVSTWFGITLSGKHVRRINLESNNLQGQLPAEIANLEFLERLYLGYNRLTGPIPVEIFTMKDLGWLILKDNQLIGEIPPEIGNSNLRYISFRNNQLTGTIPEEISNLTGLKMLSVSSNNLSGDIPLYIFSLKNLQELWLQWNNFTGPIPKEIGNLTNLLAVSFHSNQLTGPIPPELFNCKRLRFLYMGNQQLTGTIPKEIGNLTDLERLWLHQTSLTGVVPDEIINLKKLWQLWIFGNELTDLPNLTPLISLTDLRIENNRFTFEDIEPNVGMTGIHYWPQDSVGVAQNITVYQDSDPFAISVSVGGINNQYQWKKDWLTLQANDSTYSIYPYYLVNAGIYVCEITNTLVPQLTLYSRQINVNILPLSDVSDHFLGIIPSEFVMYQNYPNPFNPVTTIQYGLPIGSDVSLKVFDALGREVDVLVDEYQGSGYYQIVWDASGQSSGFYFYKIQAGDFQEVRKMMLIR